MKSITLNAPAKINLYLDVIGKRRDSYHNIATIFQKIKLYDKIKVSTAKRGISISSNSSRIPANRSNIAYKAARLMKDEFKIACGIDVFIDKRIPVAAGLGGGSSDAASVMLAVNRLFGLKPGPLKLRVLAKRLGADVPFFVSGHDCAIGTGIGERLKEVKCRVKCYVLVLVPDIRIYTKTIYRKLSLRLTKPDMDVRLLARILSRRNGLIRAANSLYNRLEDVVLPLYPIVAEGKKIMSLYAKGVLLSGSGPAVFGLFKGRKEAARAKRIIGRAGRWQLFLTEAG